MRKIFGLTFAFSAILALIVGVAFAWTASTAATPSSATGGTLSVAPYGAAGTNNQLYPTGNPISVLTGAIQNNTLANPGVSVYITGGTVIFPNANSCVSSGQVQATAATQAAADWVRANIAGMVESVQNHVGDVSFIRMAGQ